MFEPERTLFETELLCASRDGARAAIRSVEDAFSESWLFDSDEVEAAFVSVIKSVLEKSGRVIRMARGKKVELETENASSLEGMLEECAKLKADECATKISGIISKALDDAHDVMSEFGIGSAAKDCVMKGLEKKIAEEVQPIYKKKLQEKLTANLANLLQ